MPHDPSVGRARCRAPTERVRVPSVAVRIVSLLPSATEIAFALGLADDVVGVTFECDFPPDPRVGRSVVVGGLDTHGLTPGGIDALVRERVDAGVDLYTLDVDRFRSLAPDVVLTQDLCRVCALPSGTVDDALERLGCEATVVSLDPHRLEEVLASIEAVGAATGTGDRAGELVGSLRERLAAVAAQVSGRRRPRVFVLEWPDPPFVAGHWVPELVEAAGGTAVLARAGERSVPTTWEAIAEVDPDVVVVSSCGFDVEGAGRHAVEILDRLPARCDVWAIDANGLMVRPGPRVVDGVETLAALLHAVAEVDPHRARPVRRAED
jgi:iron complex transport system substrate-binding protein